MNIYTTKISKSVCKYVCTAMHFVVLWVIELKLGMGVGDGSTRFESIFLKRPHQRLKVIQRSNCFRNALWPPNLVGRTPEQSVMHCWGQRSCGPPQNHIFIHAKLYTSNIFCLEDIYKNVNNYGLPWLSLMVLSDLLAACRNAALICTIAQGPLATEERPSDEHRQANQ